MISLKFAQCVEIPPTNSHQIAYPADD